MRVHAGVVLTIGVDEAWERLLDWESQAQWMRDADRIEVLSPHREGTGVVIAVKTRVLGVPLFTERLEVVRWEPPRLLRLAHRSFVRGFGEWRLSPVARGAERGTLFTWEEHLSLGVPVLGAAALVMYRPVMRFLMRGSMENLRQIAATAQHRPGASSPPEGHPPSGKRVGRTAFTE
jgi:hypothetical protein